MARILIDGRFIGIGESISRYVLEMVKGVLNIDKENEYTLLIRPEGAKDAERFLKSEIRNLPVRQAGPKSETNIKSENSKSETNNYQLTTTNLKLKVLDIPHYSIAEQTKLLKYLNEEKFDLVHFTQFNHPVRYHGKYIVTVHDLTLVGHLHRNLPHKRLAFGLVMKSAAKDSTKIIAISNMTMNEVIDYYKVPKDKFSVIYHGIDHKNFNMNVKSRVNEIDQFKKKYNVEEDYILYTGMWKRHKNLLRMLKAFEKFRLEDIDCKIQLVLVGKVDRREPEVIKEINRINFSVVKLSNGSIDRKQSFDSKAIQQFSNSAIVPTGFIPEKELPIAYAGAFAYCIPSLSEGFGWPPLEAMACGTPVISSKESCMPEILGKAPLYFDAYNVDDIADKMKIVTTDRELREDLIKKGLEQVKKYNWQECAEKTLEVYKKILKQ